jgi:hypothetical protein
MVEMEQRHHQTPIWNEISEVKAGDMKQNI